MNVIIANTATECSAWEGTAVVVDVLRGTTTVCALAKAGKKDILLFNDTQSLQAFAGKQAGLTIFSDQDVLLSHVDNSPYLALKEGGSRPAAVLSQGASAAVFSLKKAKKILLGGFCNFDDLARSLSHETGDVLLVPASLFDTPEDVEDILCVEAIKDFMQSGRRPEEALIDFHSTMRGLDFRKNGPKTAAKDLKEALLINGMPGVLQATLVPAFGYAVCYPLGQAIPKRWANEEPLSGASDGEGTAETDSSVSSSGGTMFWKEDMVGKNWDETQLLDPVTHISLAGDKSKKEETEVSQSEHDLHTEESPEQTLSFEESATQPTDTTAPNTEEKQKESFLKRGFFKDIAHKAHAKAQDLKKEAEALKEKAQNLTGHDSSGDKAQQAAPAKEASGGFFSKIIRSIKEEKADLEQTLNKKMQPTMHTTRKFDDPFDALLKQADKKEDAPIQEEAATSSERNDFGVPLQEPLQENERQTVALSKEDSIGISFPHQEQPMAQEEQTDEVENNASTLSDIPASVQQPNLEPSRKKKAIVLFSGGLDSTTCLYWALAQGYECEALTVLYGQRHDKEVLAAKTIAGNLGIKHHVITLNLPWLVNCSLVDRAQNLPDIPLEQIPSSGIPSTYVPGRNLMFLSIAGSLLDSVAADAIVAGPNAIDFSGYPDCTPAFFKAAADALNRGTKRGVSEGIEVLAPLMRLSKAQIVQLGAKLNVPFQLTWSCYAGEDKPCGHCDSCKLRAKGFEEAGLQDPALE